MRLILFFLIFSQSLFAQDFKISKEVFKSVPFIKHEGSGQFGSYLAMNINFSPVKSLFLDLDDSLGGTLNKRNARKEAHITVVTPVEFFQVLKKYIDIKEISALAKREKIQEAAYKMLCVGKGTFKKDETYFIVVESEKLIEIRKKIQKLYINRGGEASKFDPLLFYPHITIGYTKKDLHLGPHGVRKGPNSCWKKITIH